MATEKRYRVLTHFLSYLSIGFVIIGCATYILHEQSYQSAQLWFLVGLATLFAAAICSRIGEYRARAAHSPGTEPTFLKLAPRWMYYFIAACILLSAISAYTGLLRPIGIQVMTAIFLLGGTVKAMYDQRHALARRSAKRRMLFWFIVAMAVVQLGEYIWFARQ